MNRHARAWLVIGAIWVCFALFVLWLVALRTWPLVVGPLSLFGWVVGFAYLVTADDSE